MTTKYYYHGILIEHIDIRKEVDWVHFTTAFAIPKWNMIFDTMYDVVKEIDKRFGTISKPSNIHKIVKNADGTKIEKLPVSENKIVMQLWY